jgi:23S rRNA (adenine-N6)-dimethyltransferase
VGARREWGWHQLDPRWADRLVRQAALPPGALVLDIGAGTGALTRPLLEIGARVIAVEAHPGRARALSERFGRDITVVRADAADLRLPRRPFHVVANPPFAVTSALLRRLLHGGSRLVTAHLLLDRRAAKRWMSPDAPGVRRWGLDFEVGLGRRVPRAAFDPPPTVDIVTLWIRRRSAGPPVRRRGPS